MIIHTCRACGFRVADGTGFVHVSFAEIREVQAAVLRPPGRPAGLIGAAVICWRTVHEACDPDCGDDSYCIDVERLRTGQDLAWWSSHLSAKRWCQLTDWPRIAALMSAQLAGQVLKDGA